MVWRKVLVPSPTPDASGVPVHPFWPSTARRPSFTPFAVSPSISACQLFIHHPLSSHQCSVFISYYLWPVLNKILQSSKDQRCLCFSPFLTSEVYVCLYIRMHVCVYLFQTITIGGREVHWELLSSVCAACIYTRMKCLHVIHLPYLM